MRHSSLILLKALIVILILSSLCRADESYLNELIIKANEKGLANSREWHSLIHYQRDTLFHNTKSIIDDKSFFLSNNGKYNSNEELISTLQSFFAPKESTSPHSQCKFIARYNYLKKELTFDSNRLPELNCVKFKEWKKTIDTDQVTLIFPTSFLNNPASAFGHTLLRLDHSETKHTAPLLSYAVNYSARTSGEDPISYAFKGVVGGFKGYFSVAPYYKLVTLYSDIESRDIWEYKLDLSQSEIDRLVRHIWELRGISIDYYYFDENCSYQLLTLIDSARPSLDLINKKSLSTIPIDTIKALQNVRSYGQKDDLAYRPSKATVFKKRVEKSSKKSIELAHHLIENEDLSSLTNTQLESKTKAESLELAYDYLSYAGRFLSEDTKETDQRLFEMLQLRSTISIENEPLLIPKPTAPEESHPSLRMSLGFGKASGNVQSLFSIRPAYHSLIDPPQGHTPGSQLEFFNTGISYTESKGVNIDKFTFVDIASLNNSNEFISPTSWSIYAGANRKRTKTNIQSFVPQVSLDLGKAFELQNEHSFFYSFINTSVETHDSFEDNYTFGNGFVSGLILTQSNNFALQVTSHIKRMYLGEKDTQYLLEITPRITLSKEFSLRLSLKRERRFGKNDNVGFVFLDFFL